MRHRCADGDLWYSFLPRRKPCQQRCSRLTCARRAVWRAQIHWFSIINSCVTVLLLTGFLATILMRVLKNDFVRFGSDEETGTAWPQLASAQEIRDSKQVSSVQSMYTSLVESAAGMLSPRCTPDFTTLCETSRV